MLMSHFEEPKLSDDEEPPTEQDKRKKLVCQTHTVVHTQRVQDLILQSLKRFVLLLRSHFRFETNGFNNVMLSVHFTTRL